MDTDTQVARRVFVESSKGLLGTPSSSEAPTNNADAARSE